MSEHRELKFEGEVDAYGGGSWSATDVRIGDRDVIDEIGRTWPRSGESQVRVMLGVEPVATGALSTYTGFGGTDVTPADPPEIMVGDIDLVARLRDLDGRTVILFIEDAP
jgi:hypothetical protein